MDQFPWVIVKAEIVVYTPFYKLRFYTSRARRAVLTTRALQSLVPQLIVLQSIEAIFGKSYNVGLDAESIFLQ
jgi:hypothetical protein